MQFGMAEEVRGQDIRRVNSDNRFCWLLAKSFQKLFIISLHYKHYASDSFKSILFINTVIYYYIITRIK